MNVYTMTSIRLIHFMLALCTTLSSCKEVVLWRYGLHQPRKESTRSIRKFLARQKFPNKNIFVFRDSSAYLHYLREPIHRHHLFGTTLYSSAGLLDGFKDTTHTFSCLMASLRPLDKETVIDTSAADTYAVVTWAAFLGNATSACSVSAKRSSNSRR
ncbi:MAG: hypothetical protein D4R67_06115 [Bacteroidetes bacterium]|nr:MAG: hypothetical protein D4R67_06115 [Bacteroidota bacterium]